MFFSSSAGFFQPIFNHLVGDFLFGPPLWLSPPRSMSDSFSYLGKSHSVRLRGVDQKLTNRKPPKKERLKNWFVLTKTSEPWLLVICCCCQGLATLHPILVGSASGLRCPCLSGASCLISLTPNCLSGVCFAAFWKTIFAHLDRKSSAFPTATNMGTRRICRELQTVASIYHEWRLSSSLWVEHKSARLEGPRGLYSHTPTQNGFKNQPNIPT